MHTVDILLATYNGAEFLEAQLQSLTNQDFANFRVIARDDGSTDSTRDILIRFKQKMGERLLLVEDQNDNLGSASNFSTLLNFVSARYVMFCDQDDVWHREKIRKTLRCMYEAEKASPNCPILVHSDLQVVDRNLRVVCPSFWRYQGLNPWRTSINALLVQNNVTGCGVLINDELRSRVLALPQQAIMHDWWYALVAAIFGKVVPLHEALIDYRQHGSNVEGAKQYSLSYVLRQAKKTFTRDRIDNFHSQLLKTQYQAGALLQIYGDSMTPSVRDIVATYADLQKMNWIARRVFLIRYRLLKQGIFRALGMLTII